MNTQAHEAIVISESRAQSSQDHVQLRDLELSRRPRQLRRWFRSGR